MKHTTENKEQDVNRKKKLKKLMKKVKLTELRSGETKKIMKQGSEDGRLGLPRQTKEGWRSTYINQMINSYEEFCSYMWGDLQIEDEEHFARIEKLLNDISEEDEKIAEASVALDEIASLQAHHLNMRKNGEENLPEEQVKGRRNAEVQKALAPYKSKLAQHIMQRDEYKKELNLLYSKLIEDARTTKMICTRVEKHMLQRIDVYWKAALIVHSESDIMPVIPEVVIEYSAEDAYIKPHEILMERAKKVLSKDEDDTEEEDVA